MLANYLELSYWFTSQVSFHTFFISFLLYCKNLKMHKGRRKRKRLGSRNARHESSDVHAINYQKKCSIKAKASFFIKLILKTKEINYF